MSTPIVKAGRVSNDSSFARILYNNLLSAAGSTDADAVLIANTWERWTSASGTMQDTFQPSGSVAMNAIGIAAHNLGTKGSEIVIETAPTVAGTWTERGRLSPTDDKPILFQFDTVDDVEDVRITVTGGTDREIGVVYGGNVLIMQQAIYGGHSPVNLSSKTEYRNSMSDTGQFLGRKIRRKGQVSTFDWENLTDDWYRETFQPFVESAKVAPFFIQWRPDYWQEEVAFGYTTGDIVPSNQGGVTRLVSVSLSLRAHDE